MSQIKQRQKKMPWMWYVVVFFIGLTLLLMTTLVPIWHWFPVEITEQGTVVAIVDRGCVIDTPSVGLPVIQQCSAQPGETIEVTYFVPAKVTSGYYEKIQERAMLVQP